ncbi:hypothetical protein [Wenjunlia vitaminophila]|uniref:hypothetical protein n=1 Tax=Wenjunlia vitaminophila TaxID=76728 RepID=UPI00191C3907|nr:hypothetical protein [Wenjunlia vitaminophila]
MQRGGELGEGADDPSKADRALPTGRPRRRRSPRQGPTGPDGAHKGAAEGGIRGGRVGVTYKYFGAPDGAAAARVPTSYSREELGGDELGNGLFTKVKPETMAAMVLTGIEGVPLAKVPPLELIVLHPDYAVVKLPTSVVDPLRRANEETLGAAAFIWSTVPDRRGPRDAFVIYKMLNEWQNFAQRLDEAGHQLYCLVWP